MYWLDKLLGYLNGEERLDFQCNLCGRFVTAPTHKLAREVPSCVCGSTVRLRAIIHLLSMELFNKSMVIKDFPQCPNSVGIELSGAREYAEKLAKKLNYTNTFFHKEPYLDITNIDQKYVKSCDFIISSDVFEHIAPPVSLAFENTLKLLKPGGLLILTVPYTINEKTVEHFPQLNNYEIKTIDDKKVLINTSPDGVITQFSDLIFHGGDGETLEMRIFSESGVLQELAAAGFVDIQVHHETIDTFGIKWPKPWSLPITARKAR